MKEEVSESQQKAYPVRMILSVAGMSSSTWYDKRTSKKNKERPGPKPRVSEEEIIREIKKELGSSRFVGLGYKKLHNRIRKHLVVGKNRMNRIMREQNLLAPVRPKSNGSSRSHDGRIITMLPNRMWGTDGKKFYTIHDGWCWFFSVIDHFNDEILAWHTSKIGDRFAALEPVRVSVKRVFGSLEQDVCQNTGLFLRADHGSQYDSKDFQKELKFLNLAYSPAFVRSPQCNGIIERFHRTLDEQVFDLNVFTNIEKTNIAIEQFVHDYNLYWQIHRLGLKSPIEYRESFESKSVGNLLYTK